MPVTANPDYLIVGQGLAGSLLAMTLVKMGKSVLVVDRYQTSSASRVAAGLLNPVTGRKLDRAIIVVLALAVVFLFTVHFFNNHFRPDKFPQDTTMFTGRVPLEIYIHEHRREYERLLASGELEKYLVNAPTEPRAKSASLLGAILITFGLFLLTLVITGFLGL